MVGSQIVPHIAMSGDVSVVPHTGANPMDVDHSRSDRSRSRGDDRGNAVGMDDSFGLSGELARVIDESDRIQEYETNIRQRFEAECRELQLEAEREVSSQQAIVLRTPSSDLEARRGTLMSEYQAAVSTHELAVRQVNADAQTSLVIAEQHFEESHHQKVSNVVAQYRSHCGVADARHRREYQELEQFPSKMHGSLEQKLAAAAHRAEMADSWTAHESQQAQVAVRRAELDSSTMVEANAASAEQMVTEARQQFSAEIKTVIHMRSSDMSELDIWRRTQSDMRGHEDS